ncbi:beta-N-acetylhexosaminidase [Salimicrobium flavidum]|uniref:Beta-N-acetylhexosaminidase n=1 Tax=Salimicrobium flavidum TaxID=570947 RepID=A0A1N7KBF8_9BACI|nr:beta-N-acetylhexosaminidase [Salimicrobium flavidum]SIS58948.1 beta-N-acetylhexosaminidase [Salimicrobium flavidum]
MLNRIAKIIVLLLVLLGSAFIVLSFWDKEASDQQADEQSKQPTEEETGEEPGPTLETVFDSAGGGKLPDSPVVVGKTSNEEVTAAWGEPEDTVDEGTGRSLTYPSRDVVIGIAADIVTDIRSSQENITSFHREDVTSFQDPGEVEQRQEENGTKTVFTYTLADEYVLTWVFPGSPDDAGNPAAEYVLLSKKTSSEQNAERIVNEMSLDEKIGQMIFGGVSGTQMNPETRSAIEEYHVGGLIMFGNNVVSAEQTVSFLNEMKAANEGNPSPLLLGVDEEGGTVTRMPPEANSLPTSRSIGNLNDPEVAFTAGTILGEQVQELGFNLDFAPVLDVNSNPNNPVIGDRSFGSNTEVVTNLGIQTMKGIQEEGIISVIKHFPGHGDTGVDSHLNLPQVDKSYEELRELELVPFKQAIEEGADVTMIAHILLPQIDQNYPASMSEEVITGILREDYDFDGVVITDDLTMGAITNQYSIADAAVQSVKAGGDLLLVAHDPNLVAVVFDELKAAVENGEISEDSIDESVERITELKEKYQVSDEPTEAPDFQPINEKVEAILEKVS